MRFLCSIFGHQYFQFLVHFQGQPIVPGERERAAICARCDKELFR